MTDRGHGGPVIGIVGWKNNGKTTLVVRLVEWLTARRLRVSTIKHAHHRVDIDKPGKDSYRHREAGATEAVLATAARFAIVHELRGAPEPALEELLARMSPVDLVIVEGFKRFSHPKIETHLAERGTPLIAHDDPSVVAVATDAAALVLDRPVLDLNDIEAVGRFVLGQAGIGP
ncbi:molybdopterin-guanine dinucleotide biosynthesis protein B [Marinivivus vitaminiproducens]|uniref:molybdopterin-guanine dinucleotide biosynthesis protein B n=1 Tax=Marinivivus vitaminiproducens TaxID=3035935 RepID=UPI002799FDE5|nr:molybdopterin-guanine dinucleotide biosynthesis protein B [Geminicoccaceae bacterium SCSIO 64248]